MTSNNSECEMDFHVEANSLANSNIISVLLNSHRFNCLFSYIGNNVNTTVYNEL